jgi:calcineurin-like phosphoesterase family protein
MQTEQPDAIVQLGDFACPTDENRPVLDAFRQGHPRALHVLGNHEIDKGHSFDEVAKRWEMPSRYYVESFDGLHLIVLDGNEKPENHRQGYPAHIGPEQLAWLANQLQSLPGPIIVFCHQPLAGPASVDNASDVQRLLNESADKVLMTVNGHTHVDYLVRAGMTVNLHVNSASYFWVGGSFRHKSYAEEVHASHPWIEYTCPYAEPLFTMLTIDPGSGRIHVQGKQTTWVGQSPAELGADAYRDLTDGEEISPRIRDRQFRRPPV